MSSTAIWVLDIIFAACLVVALVALVVLSRKLSALAQVLSRQIGDIGRQAGELKSEALLLMRATQVSEGHLDELTQQLTRLSSTATMAVRTLSTSASSRKEDYLSRVVHAVVRIIPVIGMVRSVFSRRKA
jgi:cell division protein ZapA (FtsZ GTPase activity inhibitor)